MSAKLKHLEFIQAVIHRLVTDSFRIKGWSVTVVAAVLALLARDGRLEFAYVALVPVVAFWGLDGYFLWQERRFRVLYDRVRLLEETEIDFSMNVAGCQDMRRWAWLRSTYSRTLLGFHGGLAVMVCFFIMVA